MNKGFELKCLTIIVDKLNKLIKTGEYVYLYKVGVVGGDSELSIFIDSLKIEGSALVVTPIRRMLKPYVVSFDNIIRLDVFKNNIVFTESIDNVEHRWVITYFDLN